MKALVLLLALIVLITSTPVTGQDWSLHTKQHGSLFQLVSTEGMCSAILINATDKVVLTAGHCIPEADPNRKLAVDGKHAEVLRVNYALDLALLRVQEIQGTAIAIRDGDVAAGTPIMVVGHGFGSLELNYGFGWISNSRDKSLREVGDKLYFATAGEMPGHSGGAVLDTQGRLVSVVQGVLIIGFGASTVGTGSPTDVVKDFVGSFWPKS